MDQQDDGTKDGRLKLLDNPLDSLRTGMTLDLRVKIAMDLLAHSPMYHGAFPPKDPEQVGPLVVSYGRPPSALAQHALDVADALVSISQERGLFERLDSPEGMERLKGHVRRQTEFQAEAQREAGRQQADSLSLARAVQGALRKN